MAAQDPNTPSVPEWSERILRLVEELKLTQAGLAERLGVSPATVSRWIQGKIEPTAIIGPGHEIATDSKGNL